MTLNVLFYILLFFILGTFVLAVISRARNRELIIDHIDSIGKVNKTE